MTCSVSTAWAQPSDPYTPIPAGFDFPADEATLERFRQTENVSEMRRHAWYVWAGINQPAPGGGPVWETWYPTSFVFRVEGPTEADTESLRQPKFEAPRQLQGLPGHPELEAEGQSALSFVLFNEDALNHIRMHKLYLQSKLNSINNGFPAGTPIENRKIPEFKPESVVLKIVWMVVQQTGTTVLPIWDFEPTQPFDSSNDPSTWKRKIVVDPSRTTIPPDEMQNGMHVVSLSSFYHITLDTPALASSAGATMGDYAVLVMMHVTTKEIPDWVWATFWWHDRPRSGPYAMDRPDAVEGVWRNYLMDVAYDTDTPREFDGTPNACMNPWIEAGLQGGMGSNCMTCHQRSTWPQVSFVPVTRGGMAPDNPFFANKTRLDFLWSVGDRAQPQ